MLIAQSIQVPAPVVAAGNIYPYYGINVSGTITASLVLGLQYRGTNYSRALDPLNLTAINNEYMYYAYPVSYGLATFLDTDSQMEGGWDGAYMDTTGALGPMTINVTISGQSIPFYVYRTDWPNLGVTHWKVY